MLVWIDVAADPQQVGSAEWSLPRRLITGYLDRYADIRFAAGASFAAWVGVVDSATRLARVGRG